MRVYAIIPARAGSKGVKNKNIRLLKEKPLLVYSIEAALQSNVFDRVIVTTDSLDIAKIARRSNAEVPFLRPAVFSQDHSSDRDYIEHAFHWFQEKENIGPDLFAILRPTTPLREPDLIALAVSKMKSYYNVATSLRSVQDLPEPPQKMLKMEGEWLTGFFPEDKRADYFNLPRQMFPTAYQPNGYIDIVKPNYFIKEKGSLFGPKMLGFKTPHSIEIDTESEFDYLKYLMEKTYA